MADAYYIVTLSSAEAGSGPNYDVFYSTDCVSYSPATPATITLEYVGAQGYITVPDNTQCVKLTNINATCANSVTSSVTTTTTTTTTTAAPTTTTTTTAAPTTTTTTTAGPVECFTYEYGPAQSGCTINWTNCDGSPGSTFVSIGNYYTIPCMQEGSGTGCGMFTKGASCGLAPTTTTTAAPTTTTTTIAGDCNCYSATYTIAELPEDLSVRYRDCTTDTVTTSLISTLLQRDNLDGTYTSFICVKQGSSYAIPVCVSGGIEVTCDPIIWIEGGNCSDSIDCDTPLTTTAAPTTTTGPISVINVFGYMEPCIGGTIDDHMGAAVYTNVEVDVDTEFEVQVSYTSIGASCGSGESTQFFYVTIPSGSTSSNFNACNQGAYFPSGAQICSACINTCDNPAVDFASAAC